MKTDLIQQLPPVFQILIGLLLVLFTGVSILGRISPALGRILFSSPDRNSFAHLSKYTLTPFLVTSLWCWVVYQNWSWSRPILGSLAWWGDAGATALCVFVGMVPSILLFASLWPLSRKADIENPDAPLQTVAGKLCIVCFIGAAVMLPIGVGGMILLKKWFG